MNIIVGAGQSSLAFFSTYCKRDIMKNNNNWMKWHNKVKCPLYVKYTHSRQHKMGFGCKVQHTYTTGILYIA